MAIGEQIGKDIITAMKAKDSFRTETLRMVKSALKSKEIDKRQPLTDQEEIQTLTTLIKQRKDSAEQFDKGGRAELAEKERQEIAMIETYMPKGASDEEILAIVQGAISTLTEGAAKPGPKDMGAVMKTVQQRVMASGLHVDNKKVSEMVKAELAK